MTAPVMERPPDSTPTSAEIPDPAKARKGFRALTENWSDLRTRPTAPGPWPSRSSPAWPPA